MIGASSLGGSFRALGGYLVQKDEGRVGWVETRNLEGRDVDQVVAEMEDRASQSERVRRPVYHVVVAFDPDDDPTEAEVRSAADRTLRDLGLQDHQALIVRHTDQAHEHVHLMVNRVGPDGKVWSKENDHHRIRASMEAQERELGVRWTGWNAERVARVERAAERSDEASELRHFYRGGGAPETAAGRGAARDRGFAAEVRASSLDDFEGASSWADLDARLAARGLAVEGRGQGAVVTDGEREAKLSSVSRSVSRGKLEARFGPLVGRSRSRGPSRPAPPAGAARVAPSEGGPSKAQRAPTPLLSRRRAATAVGEVGRRLRPVSVRGAVGRAVRGGAERDPEARAAQGAGRLTLGVARASLAGRRAAAAGPPARRDAPPGRAQRMTRGRLRGLVRARETARVERVVALVGRAYSYERAATALGTVSRYRGRVDGAVGLARQASERTRALDAHLERIYERPTEARARMLGYAETAGPGRVSALLAREPERFGKLVALPPPPAPSRPGKLFSKPAAVPDHAATFARRVQETGPLVTSAYRARTDATEAVRALGLRSGAVGQIDGRELSESVERRAGRLRGAVERGLGRVPGTRAASAELARAVRGLTPGQRARVASRVGTAGLGAVSRSVSVAKGLVRGAER